MSGRSRSRPQENERYRRRAPLVAVQPSPFAVQMIDRRARGRSPFGPHASRRSPLHHIRANASEALSRPSAPETTSARRCAARPESTTALALEGQHLGECGALRTVGSCRASGQVVVELFVKAKLHRGHGNVLNWGRNQRLKLVLRVRPVRWPSPGDSRDGATLPTCGRTSAPTSSATSTCLFH
jgi:hypothetical protein